MTDTPLSPGPDDAVGPDPGAGAVRRAAVPASTWRQAASRVGERAGGRRVLVVGWAPLPFENARMNYAPGGRAWQFARPLAADGHAVCLAAARIPGAYGGEPPAVSQLERDGVLIYLLDHELFAAEVVLDGLVGAFRPDVVVGAAAVPSKRAAELAGDRPLWVDFFGDPMAEAQAKAAVHPEGDHLTAYWQLTAELLLRGDRFSAVSERQRWALVGQLGLAGRLNRATCGRELVHTLPVSAVEAHRPPAAPAGEFRDRDFVVLWSGGYNTWCDVETLYRALESAMSQNGDIRFVSTGAGIEGQDVETYRRFEELVAGSLFRSRFLLKGRLPERRAGRYLARADLGVVTEKPIYERSLGSSARLLGWMSAGLPFVCARLSELASEAEAAGLAATYPAGDAEALARRILEAAERGRCRAAAAELAPALADLTPEATTRPLRAWVESGRRAPDHDAEPPRFLDPRALERAVLAEELAAAAEARAEKLERRYHRVRSELGEIHESTMWRVWMTYLEVRRALLWPLRWLSGRR
jgi:glycosyltransferase involved in cell wall biosynthesis